MSRDLLYSIVFVVVVVDLDQLIVSRLTRALSTLLMTCGYRHVASSGDAFAFLHCRSARSFSRSSSFSFVSFRHRSLIWLFSSLLSLSLPSPLKLFGTRHSCAATIAIYFVFFSLVRLLITFVKVCNVSPPSSPSPATKRLRNQSQAFAKASTLGSFSSLGRRLVSYSPLRRVSPALYPASLPARM